LGGGDWGSQFESSLCEKFARPRLKNNQSKKEWRCGSGSKTPVQQVQNPEFKSQYHQKINNKKINKKIYVFIYIKEEPS
jgi:hypothetical protein